MKNSYQSKIFLFVLQKIPWSIEQVAGGMLGGKYTVVHQERGQFLPVMKAAPIYVSIYLYTLYKENFSEIFIDVSSQLVEI